MASLSLSRALHSLHNIHQFLIQNGSLESRGEKRVRICHKFLFRQGEEHVKIVIFTDGRIGAGHAARKALDRSSLGCTFLEADDSVETYNRKISWYQTGDATEEDRSRPRVLVLHYDHAAGLNLQTECHERRCSQYEHRAASYWSCFWPRPDESLSQRVAY